MSNDIIKKFQKAELLLNNNAFAEIKGNDDYDYLINELIEYIEENENDQYVITTQTIRNYQDQEKRRIHESIIENPKTREIRANQETPYEILMDVTNKSYTDGDINDLNKYFNDRYTKLRKIIQENPEYREITDLKNTKTNIDNLNLVGIVNSINNTKNGHKILEIEDPTGTGTVLILKENEDLIESATTIVKDEIIGVNGSSNGTLIRADEIVHPSIQRRIVDKPMDFSVVFISDVHIGSKMFDEKAFNRFIKWINGNYGDEKQQDLANDVKYLVIGGDLVDGIGVYPNQEKELKIKDIYQQYEEAARLLGDVTDIPIILSPGNHDATRLAEPQPAITEKYAKDLCNQKNIEMVSNPTIVNLDNIKVQVYHGRSFDDIVMALNGYTHADTDKIMKLLLEKRHLAPIYGERTPLASEFEDYMVIEDVPDILHTGHVHINSHTKYKGVHMINSGTFQKQTEFQKIYNIVPTCGQIPVISHGTLQLLDFNE
ncbi:MAG: DNA-directed DNA polymerase II small subunit [Methanosphaera stadtmanae]|jgi:DNA polymerase II small subunit|nr:DNA-directed DNA polymerase II small subunit [Methanosphaera stadtmanae]